MRSVHYISALLAAFCYMSNVTADTPANCTYEDIRGVWTFYETERSFDRTLNCSTRSVVVSTLKFDLQFPNLAVDEFGNRGYWTIVYNQGFEVVINYRKYFAFSKYIDHGHSNVTSYCDQTLPGWSHDVLGNNWACFVGKKAADLPPKQHGFHEPLFQKNQPFKLHKEHIKRINSAQSSWTARPYEFFNGASVEMLVRRAGGKASQIASHPKPAPVTKKVREISMALPKEFDWRNVNGVNYVSPVRNQASCGSCYSFASVGMIESRLRIMTNNTVQLQLSPQDVVSCSEYSQGCEGGFPYLIAGKYGQDFGFVEEQCNPYKGIDGPCSEKKCTRHYVARYGYVGGFYGGCNEDLMKIELVKNGPMAIAFEVYEDFMSYGGGIYHHTGLNLGLGYNPFALTNHAVLLVGYGEDSATGEKYWLVKNSWGESWGENGYFRIRRGTNECNIETLAMEATPIP